MILALAALLAMATPEPAFPVPTWAKATPAEMGMDEALLKQARDFALKGDGSGLITRHGRLVLQWGDPRQRYDLKSSTKSFGATALALALADGKIASIEDKAARYHPTFGAAKDGTARRDWLNAITVFHLATQTAGFAKPGGTGKLLFAPGTKWAYSDSGPNWLAECITLAYRRDLRDLMFDRVFTPLGIKPSDLTWRRNAYRPRSIDGIPRRELGSGISANVDAMARLGYLYLRRGRWAKRQIIPEWFIDAARTTPRPVDGLPVLDPKTYGKASSHYGLLWWNNADGTLKDVPRDAYWSWGLYDSLIVVIPSLDIVVARAGKSFKGDWGAHYDKLVPFLGPIATSVAPKSGAAPSGAPYPPSPVVAGITWDFGHLVRLAPGSDLWPVTWADDGHLYTSWGDGGGFSGTNSRGRVSLGFARIEGSPPNFRAINVWGGHEGLHKPTFKGKTAGIVCVGGVLYAWINTQNGNPPDHRLAWSADHGATWQLSKWAFPKSGRFFPATFLNCGRDNADARDDFVYSYGAQWLYAHGAENHLYLARVHKDKMRDRGSYQFFAGLDANASPTWTLDVQHRKPVFTDRNGVGNAGLAHVVYNPGLKRTLLTVGHRPKGEALRAGVGQLGLFDAPEPWGPWTTVAYYEKWGGFTKGETLGYDIPAKWISPDGTTLWMVFSSQGLLDSFNLVKATLTLCRR